MGIKDQKQEKTQKIKQRHRWKQVLKASDTDLK
jgi:hypothetical protein